ncbi:MAG: hypothetical protein IJS39_04115 [Synergistaceae bacterium]|nr:hypothetical protein [Synergistaceae bacterium]
MGSVVSDTAYKNFLKGHAGFPKFKCRNRRPVSMYLARNNSGDLKTERRRGKNFAVFVFEVEHSEAVSAEKSSGIGI